MAELQAGVTPRLSVEDAQAAYWIGQACSRLRREAMWRRKRDAASCPAERSYEARAEFFAADPAAARLTAKISEPPPALPKTVLQGSFEWVILTLELDELSAFLMGLGLLGAFDAAVAGLIAGCQPERQLTEPTLALAQWLWDEPRDLLRLADPGHPLFRCGLLQKGRSSGKGNPASNASIGWEQPLRVPALIANQLIYPSCSFPSVLRIIQERTQPDPAARARKMPVTDLECIVVTGKPGARFEEVVARSARETGRPAVLYCGEPSALADPAYFDALATLCWLKDTDLGLPPAATSTLAHSRASDAETRPSTGIPARVFACMTSDLQGMLPFSRSPAELRVPSLDYESRRAEWRNALAASGFGDGTETMVAECARRFRFEAGTIQLIGQSIGQSGGGAAELRSACRRRAILDIGEFATEIEPRFEDDDLVLPPAQRAQFEEIYRAMRSLPEVHYGWGTARAWNEAGIAALFAGPPGTGKTMAAEVLARRLELPLYKVDLSQVVNKYIGETEKNLKRIFDAAETSDFVLFFDEADAVFGKRTDVKDSHDRYANLEISYLLERMERFRGLSILATNRRKDLDEAFCRRLRYVLDFPLPDEQQRNRMWRQMMPPRADVSGVDFEFLASRFPLSGGHIRSVIFNASLQSAAGGGRALGMETLLVAIKREYEKLNRPVSPREFGAYAPTVERMSLERTH